MSNDRLWLACRKCGELQLLAKYYGSGAGAVPAEKIQRYLDEHLVGCRGLPPDLKFNPGFDVLTELQAYGEPGVRRFFEQEPQPTSGDET